MKEAADKQSDVQLSSEEIEKSESLENASDLVSDLSEPVDHASDALEKTNIEVPACLIEDEDEAQAEEEIDIDIDVLEDENLSSDEAVKSSALESDVARAEAKGLTLTQKGQLELTASQEMCAIMRTVANPAQVLSAAQEESHLEDDESDLGLRDNSTELPENPEVSARLTNLSLRHAGARPAWFDFEPLALAGRTRQCRQLFWKIATDHHEKRKRMVAILAPSGMGKTSFLSELYSMLEHAPHSVLTLAPSSPDQKPFQALKNILEQRFYISGEASFECIERFVTGAISSIVPKEDAQFVIDGILSLWRSEQEEVKAKSSSAPIVVSQDIIRSEEAKRPPVKQRRVSPPSLSTQVTSMQAILEAHEQAQNAIKARQEVQDHKENQVSDAESSESASDAKAHEEVPVVLPIAKPLHANDVAPIVLFKRPGADAEKAEGAEECIKASESAENDELEDAERGAECDKGDANANADDAHLNDVEQNADTRDEDSKTLDVDALHSAESSTQDDADAQIQASGGAILTQEDWDAFEICQQCDMIDMETARAAIRLEKPLIQLLKADLKRNAQVFVLDDVERFDLASLVVIERVFAGMENVPFTVLMTSTHKKLLPAFLRDSDIEYVRLRSLSDSDLSRLTHHILKKLSESREKLIVPKDMCQLIAQRSFGSPKRAQELTLKHFTPDSMMHWNEAIEKLKREPLPRDLAIELVRRIRECSPVERTILQFASYLNVPFTASTLESMISTWEERACLGKVDCPRLLKALRENGFFERSEEKLGANTPTYTFKHECERLVIAGTTPKPMRHHIYGTAAQWYAMNNCNDVNDEAIGDLWRSHHSYHEACRYYERAAYRAAKKAQLQKAWILFRKLLKTLPEDCTAQRIQFSLDGAAVAFRLGHIDEAFRLCRMSSHRAIQLSAYNQAAKAHVLMASILIEIGSVRHVLRYTARANSLLNREGDSVVRCQLFNVLARRAILTGHHQEAIQWHQKARELAKDVILSSNDKLLLDWTEAEIESNYGNPLKAAKTLDKIIKEASHKGYGRLHAIACRTRGHVCVRLDDIASALEAWNIALGMAQEMNDVILHANLLGDIAEGALVLEARRTARSATEQCLGLAQQTHQKALIARCLTNTACLQMDGGLYDKAMRTLRKAHKSAVSLRNVNLWTRTLNHFAQLYAKEENPHYNPARANELYRRLIAVYEHYDMQLERARLMPEFAQFSMKTHQNMAALNAYRLARSIYAKIGLKDSAEQIQAKIDQIMQDTSLDNI